MFYFNLVFYQDTKLDYGYAKLMYITKLKEH